MTKRNFKEKKLSIQRTLERKLKVMKNELDMVKWVNEDYTRGLK